MATVDGMAAIRETFFQECAEQLAEVEAGLAAMGEGSADAETVNAVFRAVHSIKGGAGAFQLDRLVRFAHAFETALDLLRSGKIALSDALLKTMFRSNDALADLVAAARGGGEVDERRMDSLTDELRSIGDEAGDEPGKSAAAYQMDGLDFQPLTLSIDELGVGGTPPDERGADYVITFTPRAALYHKGNETTRLLRRLGQLGEMTACCDASAVPSLEALDPAGRVSQLAD
jgi:two-component system chemotaxis sensor kinase CheA